MSTVRGKWFHFGSFIGLAWLLIVLLVPVQVFAHAKVVETVPAAEAKLDQSPDTIRVGFNQKLEVIGASAMIVKDAAGQDVPLGKAVIGNDGKSMEIPTTTNLKPGDYTVNYEVISLDGHTVKGSFKFYINGGLESEEPIQAPAPDSAPDLNPPPAMDPNMDHEGHSDHSTSYVVGTESRESAFSQLREFSTGDLLKMLFYIVFLPLVGMVLWSMMLRGQTEEQTRRTRRWTVQVQRLHILVLIGILADFVYKTVGFDDMEKIRSMLLETTTGQGWLVLLVLAVLGLFLLQRTKFIDLLWIIAAIVTKTQIGHAAAADERITASITAGIHLFAASLWAGGLLFIILLWRKYRYEAVQLLPTFSSASLAGLILLTLSGLVISALYLPDLSYLLETSWGLILIAKLILVCFVTIVASVIRSRFRGQFSSVGSWIKLDFILMVLIAALAGLLTSSEPIPANEPIHWHVMGETVHMTADVAPLSPGTNNFGVTVWLPEDQRDPKSVQLHLLPGKSGDESLEIPLEQTALGDDMVFIGFNQYHFQASSDQLDSGGWWRILVVVIDDKGQLYEFEKTVRVY